MEFIKQIERIQILNKLIHEQRTGSPDELAKRLGISRRQLYVYLEYMEDHGLKIRFSRKVGSFIYSSEQRLEIAFKFEVLNIKNQQEVFGGKTIKNNYLCCF
ncbi:HTH domain-containing protein [Algoriphagus halophilus]|uniref:HTH domain-containing protein n=1 Tax=Algoriphagus halophilus TaxID=226505 RepID=UPI0035902B91